jgi:hypothetical protein
MRLAAYVPRVSWRAAILGVAPERQFNVGFLD